MHVSAKSWAQSQRRFALANEDILQVRLMSYSLVQRSSGLGHQILCNFFWLPWYCTSLCCQQLQRASGYLAESGLPLTFQHLGMDAQGLAFLNFVDKAQYFLMSPTGQMSYQCFAQRVVIQMLARAHQFV